MFNDKNLDFVTFIIIWPIFPWPIYIMTHDMTHHGCQFAMNAMVHIITTRIEIEQLAEVAQFCAAIIKLLQTAFSSEMHLNSASIAMQ